MKKLLPILAMFLFSTLSAATPEEIIAKAEAGDIDAMVYAAEKMRYGENGYPHDELRSGQWIQKAIEKKHPACVALFYYTMPNDQQEKELRASAEAGCEIAFYKLADVLSGKDDGRGASKSTTVQDERNKRAIEAYSWAELARESSDKRIAIEAARRVNNFSKYVGNLKWRDSQKKSSSMSFGDSSDRVASKGQAAAKELSARMKKKFPKGFPVWPPASLGVEQDAKKPKMKSEPAE